MKTIKLIDGEKFKMKDVLNTVVENATVQGITIAEMRKRVRVLNAIKSADDTLILEDADWETLRVLYNNHPFSIAHTELISFSESIEAAK